MSGKPVKLRIRELRAQFGGMSQADLARLSGLSAVAISNLESESVKRIELETIGKLCAVFHCSPNELFELAPLTEAEIAARQRQALSKFFESMTYDGPLDPLDPDKLDSELAEFTDRRLRSIGRVADITAPYQVTDSQRKPRVKRRSKKTDDSP
jgi:Predicted transcriptional regulator